ncbi:MAG: acetamidase/formamidase family protein [Cuniculiplasma sp.]
MKKLNGNEKENIHFKWSPMNRARMEVEDDELFEVIIPDSSVNQIKEYHTDKELKSLNSELFDGAVGPIAIKGAKPGDVIEVILDDIEIGLWGWTAIMNDFGLLKNEFDEKLVIWKIEKGIALTPDSFSRKLRIPLNPFLGIIGTSPPYGEYGMIPPQYFGGNMDNRMNRKGSRVFLPVTVEGANLSISDPHATQGDGEVCGTAIETSAVVRARVKLHKNMNISSPQTISKIEDTYSAFCTTGIGKNLYEASQKSVREMIQKLSSSGFSREESYIISSVAGNLRISEIVDEPHYVVSFCIPEFILY